MKKLVLCDLDKTILDADYQLNSPRFSTSVRAFRKDGDLIGLNSDTPLVKLLEYQKSWCMDGPTVAEMGGIVKSTDEFHIRKTESSWTDFRRKVAGQLAVCSPNYTTLIGDATTMVRDIKSLPGAKDGILVFINNLRRVSFSCFVRRVMRGKVSKLKPGNRALRDVASLLRSVYKEAGLPPCKVDRNDESGIIIFHDRQARKNEAVPRLREIFHDHIIFMIGDSMNDFLGAKALIHCAVGNASDEFKSRCRFIAPARLRYAQGVEFLLNEISEFR